MENPETRQIYLNQKKKKKPETEGEPESIEWLECRTCCRCPCFRPWFCRTTRRESSACRCFRTAPTTIRSRCMMASESNPWTFFSALISLTFCKIHSKCINNWLNLGSDLKLPVRFIRFYGFLLISVGLLIWSETSNSKALFISCSPLARRNGDESAWIRINRPIVQCTTSFTKIKENPNFDPKVVGYVWESV